MRVPEVIALEVPETSELVTRVNYADPVFDEDVRSVRILMILIRTGLNLTNNSGEPQC